MGAHEDVMIHVMGIAQLLNSRNSDFDPRNTFDASLVMVLCAVIVSGDPRNSDRGLNEADIYCRVPSASLTQS